MTSITDLIAQEAEASEANPDAPEKPGTVVTRGTSRGRTLQVRLTSDEYNALDAAAAAADLPVSSYARTVLLAAQPAADPDIVLARIRADLDQLVPFTRPAKKVAKKATPAKAAAKKATPAKAAAKKAAKKTAKRAPRRQRTR